jgi:WD40 repeat protein
LTGGLDGTLRLWDTDVKKFLYQFVGYKVWLGSLYTDGERIVTDGADNTIIMHDFSASATASKDEKKGRGDSNSRKPDQAEDTDV